MTSQNGWDLVDSSQLDRRTIPGTNVVPVPGVLKGDVATVLHWVGVQFNNKVEKLYNPGCWGWNAPTPIPGTNVYSNHCSGTAIDFNAPSFPWKMRTMTTEQRQACREIVDKTNGLVVWGGDFTTYVDEMHFEVDATDEELANLVKKIQGEEMFEGRSAEDWAAEAKDGRLYKDSIVKSLSWKKITGQIGGGMEENPANIRSVIDSLEVFKNKVIVETKKPSEAQDKLNAIKKIIEEKK